jgi:antitoxin component YwqK of YwqJK toxin-antitoxin module
MNKYKLLFIVFLFLAGRPASAQTDSTHSVYPKLDTMIIYSVNLASGPAKDCSHFDGKYPVKYFVDCKEVSKEVYLKYKNANDNLGKCTPCYMETLSKDGTLLHAGVQYTDCVVGEWTEYYPDGKVKVKGQYKENPTEKWNNIWKRGYCSVKEGTWTYYDENGNVTKTEKYKDNVLVQ